MSARYEIKYLLSFQEYELLKKTISLILHKDEHMKNAEHYPVLSLYYDTLENEYYFQKVNGENQHIKIRMRAYNQDLLKSNTLFMEKKVKIGDKQNKIRKIIETRNISDPMFWQNNEYLEFTNDITLQDLYPACFVYYEREAYQSEIENKKIRITFDKNISSCLLYTSPSPRDQRGARMPSSA